jgi:hypothetical protein
MWMQHQPEKKSWWSEFRDGLAVDFATDWVKELSKWLVPFVAGSGVVVFLKTWLAANLQCVWHRSCAVGGWSLLVLFLAVIVLVTAVAILVFRVRTLQRHIRAQRASPAIKGLAGFQPYDADDERLNLRWVIQSPPEQWADANFDGATPSVVQSIVDGPFHAQLGCLERLAERREEDYNKPPILATRCPGCGAEVFNNPILGDVEEDPFPRTHEVRAQALAELQRLKRSGMSIAPPRVLLKNPRYWRKMRPPRSRA